jgi:Tfp pilus assembly protein PilX
MSKNKGIALFMVLGTLLVLLVLAAISLAMVSSQSRLTQHQINRMRAYYAGLAGMNLAMEQLRLGAWGTGDYSLCAAGCTVNDPDIPYRVNIAVQDVGANPALPSSRQIQIAVDYTRNE